MKWTRPLLLVIALSLALMGWSWLPQPAAIAPGAASGLSVGRLLIAFTGPGAPLLALGLIAAWGAAGARGLGAGARYLAGCEREAELLLAQRALGAGARAMVSGGLIVSLLGATAAYLIVGEVLRGGESPSPVNMARLIEWALVAPLTALGVGRVVLGLAADGAAAQAGEPTRRTFGPRDDFMLLLYILPALMIFAVVAWPLPQVH